MASDLSCVVHVHSTYSDGTATVPEIAAAARRAGAGAVLVTDHDTLAARREEGFYDGVLVLAGLELTVGRGHLLAFGVEHAPAAPDAASACAAVKRAGGVGIAAHPFSAGSRMLPKKIVPPHPWPELHGCAGLELWSLTTDAAEGWRTPREAIRAFRAPERVLDGPPAHHVLAWDRLCARRRTVAVGGLDAHQTGVRVGGRVLSPMPNERWFGLLRTHLVLDRPLPADLQGARGAVYGALREGRCFLHRPTVFPADGARFGADRPNAEVPMGAEAPAGPATLRLTLPRAADVTLRKDGEPILAAHATTRVEHAVDAPGAYRAEARVAGRLWLLSNPVYLR
ncbi:MAG TPA: CehA/McbA family metallohydrolase [Solirubrobacteraceae bacterium]|jgi:hypothetical protein